MSFDVFLQTTGKEFAFSGSIVKEAFEPFIMNAVDSRIYRLIFPGGGSSDLYLDQKPMIDGFAVMAAGGLPLYDTIYEVLARVPRLYMYWGGGSVVADPTTISLMPEPLIEAFGPPTVVHSGQDIVDAIRRGP